MNYISHSWRRAVIKVGSALIAPDGNSCSTRYLLSLVEFIQFALQQDKQIVLVSSGSVAAGHCLLAGDTSKPLSIPYKQAMAAVGQSHLMQHWQKLFDKPCAQILLTRSDLESEKAINNIKNTLNKLIELNSIPVINENDPVATDELVVGDNDNLAAHVAVMCEADLLIICSDVDGLYDKNPMQYSDAKLITKVDSINQEIINYAGPTVNTMATGGMFTKLQAASIATSAGIDTLLINGTKNKSFDDLKNNQSGGTYFPANQFLKERVAEVKNEFTV